MTTVERRRAVYAAVVVFVTVFAAFIGNLMYTNHVDQQRERDRARQAEEGRTTVCALVNANLGAFAEQPPQTGAGQKVREAWQRLKLQFDC